MVSALQRKLQIKVDSQCRSVNTMIKDCATMVQACASSLTTTSCVMSTASMASVIEKPPAQEDIPAEFVLIGGEALTIWETTAFLGTLKMISKHLRTIEEIAIAATMISQEREHFLNKPHILPDLRREIRMETLFYTKECWISRRN